MTPNIEHEPKENFRHFYLISSYMHSATQPKLMINKLLKIGSALRNVQEITFSLGVSSE